ncbi:MAG: glycoside hydrolase/phage tail family protein, partial [Caulobacteraceae bacterium]|nr:glycoside hydrolase/phage tail family protein [Caulobacteraceae bacterium]
MGEVAGSREATTVDGGSGLQSPDFPHRPSASPSGHFPPYATEPVLKRDGLVATQAENVNNTRGGADFLLALDQLEAQLPNVSQVTLVVAWFGSDLRCGVCEIRPGVEVAAKDTLPIGWSVDGLARGEAHLISQQDGGPAYGGTPADATVVAAIQELKSRGYSVGLYPFILMDVPPGNGLPDPYGGEEQAPYPWRGRITCAAGTDQTFAAADQVDAFFEGEWGFRRMVLHCADLAQQAGGVDAFLIGSELRGLTWVRSGASAYPAVAKLKTLAADCRAVLGTGTKISYAADWSEYFGHQPADGSGDAHFHLDPLWADENIDFVGIDWYAPMADWREGTAHLDAQAGWRNTRQVNYLRANLAGGEGFDWYYASPEDRTDQVRTPITDGAYGEPWVYRYKDLISWWSNAHHDRPGGVRAEAATGWVPQSKPLRFVEFGCPAVDKGANAPNLFIDPKSSESHLPPFSNGRRDDLMQRRALEAVLKHFGEDAANPVSAVYGGPMLEAMAAWCWDARPYPDFPAREDVWKDAPNWTLGHWLNGRVGSGTLADLVRALGERAGVDLDVEDLEGEVTGYVVERPMRLSQAIAPLAAAYGFDGAERELATFLMRERPAAGTLGAGDLAFEGERPEATQARVLEPAPQTLRVRFIDEQSDYQTGAVAVRRDPMAGAQSADADLPIVMEAGEAEVAARRMLRAADGVRDELVLGLSPATALGLQTGDVVRVEGRHGDWRVTRLDRDARPTAVLALAEAGELAAAAGAGGWTPPPPVPPLSPPVLHLLDLPPLPGFEDDARPLVAVAAEPWRAMEAHAGPSAEALTVRAQVPQPATVGVTRTDLPAGPLHRFSPGAALEVELASGRLESRPLAAVLAGANALAVQGAGGAWEVLQFTGAEQVGAQRWRLTGLLRGQLGSEPAMVSLTPAGAAVVVLAGDLARGAMALDERGLPLVWRAAPAGG